MSQVPFPGQVYPGDPAMQQPVYPYPPAQQQPVTQQIPPAMATSFGGHVQVPQQPAMTPIDTLMKVILPRLIEKSKAHDEAFSKLQEDIASLHMRLGNLVGPDYTKDIDELKEQMAALTAATAKKPRASRKKKEAAEEPTATAAPVSGETDAPMYMGADGKMYANRELAPGLRLYPDDDYLQNPLVVDGQPIDAEFIRKVKELYAKTNGLHNIEAMADIYDINEKALAFYHTLPGMTVERILSLGG